MSRDLASPEPRAFPGARLRDTRGGRVIYGLFALLAALIAGAAAGIPEVRGWLIGVGAVLAIPLGLAVAQFRRNILRGGARLEVRADGVHVEGRLALPRASMERADVVEDAAGVTVAIRRRHGYVAVIDVADVEEGQAIVRALGLSAEQALSTFQLDSPMAPAAPAWLLYVFVMLGALFLPGPLALLGVAFGWVRLLAGIVPARLVIGLDGVLVRWLWRSELIRFADLRGVDRDGERLHLRLANGRARSFSARWVLPGRRRTSTSGTGFASRAAYLDAVAARVREATVAGGRTDDRSGAALLRRGRPVSAWVSALRGVLERGAGGFREAETPPEKLWGTVEDGAAEPEARAAAAIALGPALDDAERQRLRRAARVVVAPALRIAIEAVGDGDDERLLDALAEIEAAREERRRG